jgi:hypothetical protein
MTERVKSWVTAVFVVILLEVLRGRHLSSGYQLGSYALVIFVASLVLYWLPPRDTGIARWLIISFAISLLGASLLVLVR